jgi:hypothetical protein
VALQGSSPRLLTLIYKSANIAGVADVGTARNNPVAAVMFCDRPAIDRFGRELEDLHART